MNAAIIIMQGLIAGATAFYALEMWRLGRGVTAAFTLIIGVGLFAIGEKIRRFDDEPSR